MGKKPFVSRNEAEEKEGLEQVTSDVANNKMQATQQVATVSDAERAKPADSSFNKKKVSVNGSALKQEKISDAITGSSGVTGMGINFAGRSVSGTSGGVLGANNSTVSADKSRKDTRVGKKLDRLATKLNYTPCDQYIVAVDESKPLADAANEDQGFNGTYRNESARSQKIMGAVPADLLYQRSVDLITKDKLYFVEGQQVYQNNDDRTDVNPSEVYDKNSSSYVPVTIKSGNYLHRNMHIGLSSLGDVNYVYFDVDDLTPDTVSADDANVCSAHRLIKQNVAELDRMNMDSKAGDEKADVWTPLARAIKEPTKWSYLLSSMEAETGAYVHLAYSKASTNMAYQLNRASKDGIDVIGPAIEQCLGWRNGYSNSHDLKNNVTLGTDSSTGVFRSANYDAGDPSLMIDAYDSVAKYNNKADFVLQPRGYRMHLQTADNNMNPLHLPKEYANVYAATEAFSTIDHEYDGLLPICMTDKANLILNHNLNELGAFYKNGGFKSVKQILTFNKFNSSYTSDSVKLVKSGVPAKMGWTTVYGYYKIDSSLDENQLEATYDGTNHILKLSANSHEQSATIKILISDHIVDTTDEDSEWYQAVSFLKTGNDDGIAGSNITYDISYNAPQVQDTTNNKISVATLSTDSSTWYYQSSAPIKYMYEDLRNIYITDVKHPLVFGIVEYLKQSIGKKFYDKLGSGHELKIPFIFSTQYMTLAQLLICAATPWILRVRTNSMRDVIYYEDNVHEYPFSKLASIKDVPFKNYENFDYSDYDSPLSAKIMNPVQAINWIMPEFFWKIDSLKYVLPWYFNENDLNSDGSVNDDASNMSMPSIRSGVRLASLDTFYSMSEKDIRLSLDRMTKTFLRDSDISSFLAYKYGRTTDGQIAATLSATKLFSIYKILSCPRELGLSMDAPLGVLTVDPADYSDTYLGIPLKAASADGTATSYRIKIWTNPNTLLQPSILGADGINITRGANYVQKWVELCANGATSGASIAGLVFGLGDDGNGVFKPFAALGTGAQDNNFGSVISHQRALNTRIQFLPFIISPFDSVHSSGLSYSPDIYDFAYYFGLAGFRASDYRESVYNREKEVVNQGLLFTDDPWILASPILKQGSHDTGLSLTKGYTL